MIDLGDNKKPLFYFFQTELTNCFVIQSIRFVCFVIYSILMPKTRITLSKLGHAQSIFSSLIYSLSQVFFSVSGHLQCLLFSGKRFSQNRRSSRSAFQGISGGL